MSYSAISYYFNVTVRDYLSSPFLNITRAIRDGALGSGRSHVVLLKTTRGR